MSSVKTDGIVLRYAGYGEANRMVTLLTPGMGLLSVSARGTRKMTSRTLAATELFTAGEYLLHEKGGRYTLSSFSLSEGYFPIRLDVDKLTHGVYWLNLVEAAAQPGEESVRLYRMLLLSLAVLAYGEAPLDALTATFLSQFASVLGFAPRLDACARCGKPIAGGVRFDAALGGLCCPGCGYGSVSISPGAIAWLQEAQAKGAFVLAGKRQPPAPPEAAAEALAMMRAHVEHRLERALPAGKFL